MATTEPRILLRLRYEKAAQEYLRNLPPEHFMEATLQATQRAITLASFALIRRRRSDFHYFNELLVQYPLWRKRRPGQVVPDNMVVLHSEPIIAEGSYDVPLQPVRPFWVLEYVSKSTQRKDYEDNMRKYEKELKVPYYLLFAPEAQELTLYRHNRRRYVSVKPNENNRYALPELDLEMALVDGWVRFWYQGELLQLPADIEERAEQAEKRAAEAEQKLREVEQQLAQLQAQQKSSRPNSK